MAGLQFDDVHQQPPRPVMTAEESEKVIEMWAQRQQHADAIQQMPSVHELSEALNAPPAEVFAILDQIRGQELAQTKTRKKFGLKWIRIPAAVAGIAMLMIVSGGVGWKIGRDGASARFGRNYSAARGVVAPPATYTVSFDGFSILGEGTAPSRSSDLMRQLERAVMSAIDQMAPSRDTPLQPMATNEELVAKLASSQKIPGLLDYRRATIKGPNGTVFKDIPYLIHYSPAFEDLVRAEQQRRIKQLVSSFVVGPMPAK